MAGSYKHIVNNDGSFCGVELLDNLGDAYEALEECYDMIQWLTGGDRDKIAQAWLEGYIRPRRQRHDRTLSDQEAAGLLSHYWRNDR